MRFKIKLPSPKREEAKGPLFDVVAVQAAVKERMKLLQLRAPRRPLDAKGEPLDPRLPYDLTALSDVAIGTIHGEFALMAQYATLHLAIIGVESAARKKADKITRAKVRLEKTGTNPDKEAKVEVDPRVRTLGFDVLVGESTYALTEAAMHGYLIGRDAVSREMSRRMGLDRQRNV